MWQEVLAAVVPVVVALIGLLGPVVLRWLKQQDFVERAHLESLLDVLIPKAIEWAEWWGKNLYPVESGRNPSMPVASGELKLTKAKEWLRQALPSADLDDTTLRLRIEDALQKGLNKKE
jgi:hypothetical protein